jgi:magnesium transporter
VLREAHNWRNSVNPLYYVTFTTGTICASLIFYGGFNTTDAVATLSLLCGFLVTFAGVYLLNISRRDPDGSKSAPVHRNYGLQRSFSLDQGRNDFDHDEDDREGLMHAFDEELELDTIVDGANSGGSVRNKSPADRPSKSRVQ